MAGLSKCAPPRGPDWVRSPTPGNRERMGCKARLSALILGKELGEANGKGAKRYAFGERGLIGQPGSVAAFLCIWPNFKFVSNSPLFVCRSEMENWRAFIEASKSHPPTDGGGGGSGGGGGGAGGGGEEGGERSLLAHGEESDGGGGGWNGGAPDGYMTMRGSRNHNDSGM